MPRKAESKRGKQEGKAKAAGKSKPAAKPQDGDTLVDLIEALNAPVAPQTAFNPPGRTFWPEPNGCVRGPEEDDAAFDRRVRANAESLKEMMLRNKHNATTVEARTDAELAIESMGTPGDFQRLQQEKRYEEEDRRREEAKARGLRRQEGGKAKGASPDFHLADLVFFSFANTREFFRRQRGSKPGDDRYPKETDEDEAAQHHIVMEIVKRAGVSEASVRSYAACAAVGVPLVRRGGECGEPKVSEALAQLHREGLTQRLLAYLWENFPDFAEARGLPLAEDVRADLATEQGDHAGGSGSSPAQGRKVAQAVPSAAGVRDKVFISYSHADKKFLDELQTHLKPLIRKKRISIWSDEQIEPGAKWFEDIKLALATTKVAVLLVTKDFLASDFIHEHELGPLLKEAEQGRVKIRWVLVRACTYSETPLKDYQTLIPPDKPLAKMTKAERDGAWVKICEAIKAAL